jgi:hypothetical protein
VDLLNLRVVRTLSGILVQDFRGHITVGLGGDVVALPHNTTQYGHLTKHLHLNVDTQSNSGGPCMTVLPVLELQDYCRLLQHPSDADMGKAVQVETR